MKYTLIAIAALSSSALAQTQNFAFLDSDPSDGSTGVYQYTYDHGTGTWSAPTTISGGWHGWTDISYNTDGTLYGYNHDGAIIWSNEGGGKSISTNAPTQNASGSSYVSFAVDGNNYYFTVAETSKADIYTFDAATDTFTYAGQPNNTLSWSGAWRLDKTAGVNYGYAINGGTSIWNGPGSVPASASPNGANWNGFAAGVIVTPVPEPSSAALLGLGGLALILRRRK